MTRGNGRPGAADTSPPVRRTTNSVGPLYESENHVITCAQARSRPHVSHGCRQYGTQVPVK
ncbi:hypothetical protein I550_0602 [Mycobacterium intracellulare 1956]|uniref:Uncharacterized protein n=1 Tax=Mycobacterium intracellulare 1956 TaxID=1299331 RepID=X8CM69_MYCIT|nr:hypothetical protein I550_0602 [Mycobacterium intracellulare 1956]